MKIGKWYKYTTPDQHYMKVIDMTDIDIRYYILDTIYNKFNIHIRNIKDYAFYNLEDCVGSRMQKLLDLGLIK